MNKEQLFGYQLSQNDFSKTIDGVLIKHNSNIIKKILHDQAVVNRIKMIIKDKENEVAFMESRYPTIDSELHNLHHSWKAKLDDIDMFRELLA